MVDWIKQSGRCWVLVGFLSVLGDVTNIDQRLSSVNVFMREAATECIEMHQRRNSKGEVAPISPERQTLIAIRSQLRAANY